jgi:translocation and assembly module TamB
MEDADLTELSALAPKSEGRKRRIFGGVLLLLIVLLAIAYWQRIGLANRLVKDGLAQYGVDVSYTIKDVGLRTQRLENVRIGSAANPDLIAKMVEVDVLLGFSGATIRQVRAQGVRLHGRYADGMVSFGALDKFRDPASKKPFEFPDLAVDIKDTQVTLDTPWGRMGAGLDGTGHLRNRFAGNLAVRAPILISGDCGAKGARFDGRYAIEGSQPHLIGPLLAETLTCTKAGFAADKANVTADIRVSKNFDRWVGNATYAAKAITTGSTLLSFPRGSVDFDGGKARTNFTASIDRAGYRGAPLTVRNMIADAKGHIDSGAEGMLVAARGQARLLGGALDSTTLAGIDSLSGQAQDTPVGPLLAKLGPAVRRAAADFDGDIRYDARIASAGASTLLLDGLNLTTKSGALVTQSGVASIGNKESAWHLASPLQIAMSGGDLPTASVALRQGIKGVWSGTLMLSPFVAKGASLAVSSLAFAGRPGAPWTFNGKAKLSGPLPGGTVSGLDLPIDGRWDGRGVSLYQSCQTVRFDSARVSSLWLNRQSLRLCPENGRPIFSSGPGGTRLATTIPDFGLTGALGGSPIQANSALVRFDLNTGFTASNVKVVMGRSDARTHFDVATLGGRFDKRGIAGTLSGGAGQIGNVPLLLEDAAGNWTYHNSILSLEGATRVLDAEQVDRFQPMIVPDMLVNLENGVISAIGSLHEPKTGRTVTQLDIRHTLATTTGRALLSVDDLRFDTALQPELLTPLTLGVVANVNGSVSGDGRIEWDANGVRSSGRFDTKKLDFAAAFGPVEGMSTQIVFTDLLGLQTAPGQRAKIASVNPGIAALNGGISYQLLPNRKIAVEGGRWPFAGGELVLEPTVLDFGIESQRRLTFRVVGIDAEKFLAQYEFENLRVSGVFDGTLPMVFDADGGRIVGGTLHSRSGGGELSYLGELSYKDMGVFANYAFQALKSIRYKELSINVGGDLGGEIITKVSFSGVQQGSLAKRNFITKQLANIPIKFNISITAEFLKLIGSIRSIYDPSYDNQQMLPDLLARQAGAPPVTGETPKSAPENKQKDE